MQSFEGPSIKVYLFKNKIVVEFKPENITLQPTLPFAQLYTIDLSEIKKVSIVDNEVCLLLRDGSKVKLSVYDVKRLFNSLKKILCNK